MASRSGGKGSRAALAKTLKGLGIKNVTPAVIAAAQQFTGSSEAIDALRKPSGEETYFKNAVGRLKTDAQIEAEKTGAFDRTAQIASDLGISVPAVVSGYTSALGGLAGDLAAFGGGDARNALALDQTGASVAGMVTDLGTGASRMAASVKDLIAANADVYAATAKANRDTKREELLQGMRKAEDARRTALTAARVSAQSGILGNVTTLLGLRDSYGSGSGGYGGGSGGSGDGDLISTDPLAGLSAEEISRWDPTKGQGTGYGSSATSTPASSTTTPAQTGTSGGTGARSSGNTPGYNTPYARAQWAKQEAERIKKNVKKNNWFYGAMPVIPDRYRPTSSSNAEDRAGDFSGVRSTFG
jgi:hypothetical protein